MTEMSRSGKPISEPGGYDEVQVIARDVKYFLNGELHRIDGPAHVTAEGDESWYWNGHRHRDDGPAIVSRNGMRQWWVNGVRVEAPAA